MKGLGLLLSESPGSRQGSRLAPGSPASEAVWTRTGPAGARCAAAQAPRERGAASSALRDSPLRSTLQDFLSAFCKGFLVEFLHPLLIALIHSFNIHSTNYGAPAVCLVLCSRVPSLRLLLFY